MRVQIVNISQTNCRGLTLVELMVGLAIAGIMMVFAVPAFNNFTNQQRIGSNVNYMISAVNYARSEAARQGGNMSIQAFDNSDNANEWGPGFCVTAGNPGNCNTPLVRFQPEGQGSLDGVLGLQGIGVLTFNSRGLITGGVTGNIEVCGANDDQDPGRVVRISATGRASVGELDCFP